MKGKKAIWIGTSLVLLANIAIADPKSDWQKMLDRYCALSMKMDGKGTDAIVRENFAKDFKFVSSKGQTIGLEQWIEQGHQEMKMTEKMTKVVLHIDSVKMLGKDKALCKMSIVFEGMMKMDPKAKAVPMKSTAKADMTMAKKGAKWWIQTIKSTEEQVTINGKPFKG